MLLITDRVETSGSLERVLALWGSCVVAEVNGAPLGDRSRPQFVLTDIDLLRRASVMAAREMLASVHAEGQPHLCLLREGSARAAVQANAIGATDTLSSDASSATLREKIGEMLGKGGPLRDATELRRDVSTAVVALSDMLAAAAAGKPLPLDAIDRGVLAINRAAAGNSLDDWLALVRGHDDMTYQHCLLVSGLAGAFGSHLGFCEEDRKLLTCAAVLHDVGKARIPLDILQKDGGLTVAERDIVRRHPAFGYDMLVAQGGFRRDVLAAVLSHHEYLDGSGYPNGLRGGEISDLVRMVTICDVYGALIERRSYKPALLPGEAFGILSTMTGKLDPALLRAFEEMTRQGGDAVTID